MLFSERGKSISVEFQSAGLELEIVEETKSEAQRVTCFGLIPKWNIPPNKPTNSNVSPRNFHDLMNEVFGLSAIVPSMVLLMTGMKWESMSEMTICYEETGGWKEP